MSLQVEDYIVWGITIVSMLAVIYIVVDILRNNKTEIKGFKCFITRSEYYILTSRASDLNIKFNMKPSLGSCYVALTFYGDLYTDDDGEIWIHEKPLLLVSKSKRKFDTWKYKEVKFETIVDYMIALEENDDNTKVNVEEI